jgi:hypothetical protein
MTTPDGDGEFTLPLWDEREERRGYGLRPNEDEDRRDRQLRAQIVHVSAVANRSHIA